MSTSLSLVIATLSNQKLRHTCTVNVSENRVGRLNVAIAHSINVGGLHLELTVSIRQIQLIEPSGAP